MQILITGGAGFIGSNLVEHYNRSAPEVEVTVIDDLSTGSIQNLTNLEVDFIEGSILDDDILDGVVGNMDAVIHLAALGSVPRSVKDPVQSHNVNIDGTLKVLEAARKTGTYVVFASSSSVYGTNKQLPKSEYDWTRPMSPYGVTKLAAEAYVLAYQLSYGLPTLAFRFFNVFGPKQPSDHAYAAVVPALLDAALDGRALPVHGDGLQSRDFTYVDTVCQTISDAVERQVISSDPVNLAFGSNTSIMELIEIIRKVSNLDLTVQHLEPRIGDVRASQADGTRLRELFPETSALPLELGIQETLSWFQRSGKYQR